MFDRDPQQQRCPNRNALQRACEAIAAAAAVDTTADG